jgi:hypothetical protein
MHTPAHHEIDRNTPSPHLTQRCRSICHLLTHSSFQHALFVSDFFYRKFQFNLDDLDTANIQEREIAVQKREERDSYLIFSTGNEASR